MVLLYNIGNHTYKETTSAGIMHYKKLCLKSDRQAQGHLKLKLFLIILGIYMKYIES